jgi:hypothetical protein
MSRRRFQLKEPYTGNLVMELYHAVMNNYGNRALWKYMCFDTEGTQTTLEYNTYAWSDTSWTKDIWSHNVTDCKIIRLLMKDIGKGAPRFKIAEVTLTDY